MYIYIYRYVFFQLYTSLMLNFLVYLRQYFLKLLCFSFLPSLMKSVDLVAAMALLALSFETGILTVKSKEICSETDRHADYYFFNLACLKTNQ